MKILIFLVLALVLTSCASTNIYVEPSGRESTNLSFEPFRIIEGQPYLPKVLYFIDGARIKNEENFRLVAPEDVKIALGSHNLQLDITVYNNYRAKYKRHLFQFEAEKNTNYLLRIVLPETYSEDIKADSEARIEIVSISKGDLVYEQNIVLIDNRGRSAAGPDVVSETVGGIVSGISF